jgi:hypothetical protein
VRSLVHNSWSFLRSRNHTDLRKAVGCMLTPQLGLFNIIWLVMLYSSYKSKMFPLGQGCSKIMTVWLSFASWSKNRAMTAHLSLQHRPYAMAGTNHKKEWVGVKRKSVQPLQMIKSGHFCVGTVLSTCVNLFKFYHHPVRWNY